MRISYSLVVRDFTGANFLYSLKICPVLGTTTGIPGGSNASTWCWSGTLAPGSNALSGSTGSTPSIISLILLSAETERGDLILASYHTCSTTPSYFSAKAATLSYLLITSARSLKSSFILSFGVRGGSYPFSADWVLMCGSCFIGVLGDAMTVAYPNLEGW